MNTVWRSRYEDLRPDVTNLVDGQSQSDLQSGPHLDKYSPRDGRLLYRIPLSDNDAVDRALANSRKAFADGRWSRMPAQLRKEILISLASMMEARREELALLECVDVGKPISDALSFDVPQAAAYIRFCAEAIDKNYGKVYGSDASNLSYELRRPIGVVAGIVGWNFPLYLAAQKVGPALAAGNCFVLKPSELTSLSAIRLAELALEAGVPKGVFNVIHGGAATGIAIARHHEVDLLSFTGSTRTGKSIMVASGESNMKGLILECGGKSPNIVFDTGLDLGAVADSIIRSAFWNQGQVCVASSRLLVQDTIKDALVERIVHKMSQVECGDPLCPETKYAALVSREHKDKVLSYLERANAESTQLTYQGTSQAPIENGFYMAPAVVDGVRPGDRIAQEEIFGPILCVMSFCDEEEAADVAGRTIYGLSATLWTKDLGQAQRMSQTLDVGWLAVNTTGSPSGGPGEGVVSIGGHKQSGIGTEGGIEGLEAYMSKTTVQFFV